MKKSGGKSKTKNTHCANENLFVTEIYVFEPHRKFPAFSFAFRLFFFFFVCCIGAGFLADWVVFGIRGIDVIAAAAAVATPQPPFVILVLLKCTQRLAHTPTQMTSARFVQLSENSNLEFRKMSVP